MLLSRPSQGVINWGKNGGLVWLSHRQKPLGGLVGISPNELYNTHLGGGFEYLFIFTSTWGNNPI